MIAGLFVWWAKYVFMGFAAAELVFLLALVVSVTKSARALWKPKS